MLVADGPSSRAIRSSATRAAALMRAWTWEITMQQAWEAARAESGWRLLVRRGAVRPQRSSSKVPQRFTTTRKLTKSQSLNSIEFSEHHILNASSSAFASKLYH